MKKDEAGELRRELTFIRGELAKISERLRPLPRCMGPKEAAKMLGVGVTKMRELIADGDVKTVSIGSRQMVTLAEIERLTSKTGPKSPARATSVVSAGTQDPQALRDALRRR